MKNNTYSLNYVYSMVRDYYMDSFPHGLNFVSFEAVNLHLKNSESSARLEVSDGLYSFRNQNPTIPSDDVFTNGTEEYAIGLEKFLADKSNINNLIKDVNALTSWLKTNDFIKDGIATEKMLEQRKLI